MDAIMATANPTETTGAATATTQSASTSATAATAESATVNQTTSQKPNQTTTGVAVRRGRPSALRSS